jgi:hypothetical protein
MRQFSSDQLAQRVTYLGSWWCECFDDGDLECGLMLKLLCSASTLRLHSDRDSSFRARFLRAVIDKNS